MSETGVWLSKRDYEALQAERNKARATALAATALYDALGEIIAKVALKLPMYAIEYDKASKAIADYEAVKG